MRRRFTAVFLAAATTVSLGVAPAGATTSSDISNDQISGFVVRKAAREALFPGTGISAPFLASSQAGMFDIPKEGTKEDFAALYNSSVRNDIANNYKLGTTADIIVGTLIATSVLAVLGGVLVSMGVVQLPN